MILWLFSCVALKAWSPCPENLMERVPIAPYGSSYARLTTPSKGPWFKQYQADAEWYLANVGAEPQRYKVNDVKFRRNTIKHKSLRYAEIPLVLEGYH